MNFQNENIRKSSIEDVKEGFLVTDVKSQEESSYVIKRLCSFYASNLHLAAMLLPYLNNEIENGTSFITLFEIGIKENIQKMIENININHEVKEKIQKIEWTGSNKYNYSEISKHLDDTIKTNLKNTIIINGSEDYISIVNKSVNTWITNNLVNINKKNISITIINCFDITNENMDMTSILDEHDLVLNTSGEKKIEEVFTNYKKSAFGTCTSGYLQNSRSTN